MTHLLFGGAVLASFLAGMVALFAPCCISVMLPAYFASSFATKRALIAMTFVFAAGLGLIILPIALGAAAIGSLVTAHHLVFYLAGGALMLGLGIYMLVGGKLMLPMPAIRARRGSGLFAVLSRARSRESPAPAARRSWRALRLSPAPAARSATR